MPRTKVVVSFGCFKIYFDNVLFLFIDRNELIGIQSWYEGGNRYCIEFYTKSKNILTEYDSEEKWTSVLSGIDNVIEDL